VKSLVFWNRLSGEVRRFPATGAWWPFIDVLWDRESNAVFYSEHKSGQNEETDLARMTLDGQKTSLVSYACDGFVSAHAVGPDGSLYFTAGVSMAGIHKSCDASSDLMRRFPDGTLESVLSSPSAIYDDQQSDQLVIYRAANGTPMKHIVTLLDMRTGNTTDTNIQESNNISPHGRWVLQSSGDGTLLITPIK